MIEYITSGLALTVTIIAFLMSPYARRVLGITMPSLREFSDIVHIWSDRMKEKGYDSFDDITPSDILELVNSLWNLLVNHFINQFGLKVKYNP